MILKPKLLACNDIFFPIFPRQICFINHKFLFGFETSFKDQFFPVFRSQHIEIDTNVRIIKSFLEKG